ncbi:nonsense-mediated mRNA decay NMD3 family protein [Forsythia ovata]|uniref:60S ribosomal export protein NMD3 n=1 Tax=Forsythia ovata TaxID=205694 RepID=A0ABD1WMR2_9LAMI
MLEKVEVMAQEAGMFTVPKTIGSVLCCKCGILMQPNAANMCAKCLLSEVDITEGLQKHVVIIHCPECESYLQPPRTWIKTQLESKELLTFCIKRLKNLNKVHLVHAEFIWTEPHSKRIKVRLRVQKEVLNGAVLEQAYTVKYVVQDQMCESCTFRLILINGWLQFNCGSIHAGKFVDFVGEVAPIRKRNDKQLVSHDQKSNNYNYKYTFSVEICPICREDLICLPPKVAASQGNLGPLVICTKVTNSVALLDPFTLRHCFLNAEQYSRVPFTALLSSRQLVEYIVLDIETVSSEVVGGGSKYVVADAQITRVSDFGKNDIIFNVRTHLGHLLNPGDYALGCDLYGANSNDIELDRYNGLVVPEVILIKKSYEEKRQRKRNKPRSWKLKSLNMEIDNSTRGRDHEEKMDSEYEQFKRDLEENPELRFNISLYRNKEYQPSEMASETDGEDFPSIRIEELLADLELSDEEMGDGNTRE